MMRDPTADAVGCGSIARFAGFKRNTRLHSLPAANNQPDSPGHQKFSFKAIWICRALFCWVLVTIPKLELVGLVFGPAKRG